ncbi:MAG: HEPN domain-containing protein [Candidatus Aenigmarchaeota archaeon]|nr:HEPN domain-containing protein [Candidatus Aenigmarchaeota archaeon]
MKEVEEWLKRAEKDLRTAKVNLENQEYEACAFFSHQAAEKALKALYILKFKRLWKIHDLEKLCSVLKAGKKITNISRKLNPHYIETRYPVETEYTEKVAKAALEGAKEVVKWVKGKLRK